MLQVELSTLEIIQYLKSGEFPFYQKTLLRDAYFDLPVGIFTPTKMKNNKFHLGNFQSLLNQSLFDQIILLDTIALKKDLFLVQEIILTSEQSMKINDIQKLSWLEIRQKFLEYRSQKLYITPLILQDQITNKNKLSYFILKTYFYFPFIVKPIVISKIAIIYDKTLLSSTQEALEIYKYLDEHFGNLLSIALFSTPITEQQLTDIFNQYSIIHYAGHMSSKGFLIQKKLAMIPKIKKPPAFVFINSCHTPYSLINYFASLNITTVYSNQNQMDSLIAIKDIIKFYLGLFLGYRIQDLMAHFPENLILSGWSHFSIKGFFYE